MATILQVILKPEFFSENVCILIKVSLMFVPKGPVGS